MITSDYHVHSFFSSDSKASMESMIERAITLGFTRICFTDHMDYDFPKQYTHNFEFDPEEYFKKLKCMKETYQDKIKVLYGIECGMQPHLGKRFNSLITSFPFDFVICSSHIINGQDPYFKEFWNDMTKEQGINLYLDSILANMNAFDNFDVYGHLDYVVRYVPEGDTKYDYLDYKDKIDTILLTLIQKGKGIEVNTAGYKYGLGTTNPKEEIIKRYLELGGTILTIGSDGHTPEHLGYDFENARKMLKSLGIKEYTVFENRTPIQITL